MKQQQAQLPPKWLLGCQASLSCLATQLWHHKDITSASWDTTTPPGTNQGVCLKLLDIPWRGGRLEGFLQSDTCSFLVTLNLGDCCQAITDCAATCGFSQPLPSLLHHCCCSSLPHLLLLVQLVHHQQVSHYSRDNFNRDTAAVYIFIEYCCSDK